jgi:hypothetical protein
VRLGHCRSEFGNLSWRPVAPGLGPTAVRRRHAPQALRPHRQHRVSHTRSGLGPSNGPRRSTAAPRCDFDGVLFRCAATRMIEATAMPDASDTPAPARGTGAGGSSWQRARRRPSAMARRATGTIETHPWRDGRTVTVRARLRAYDRRYRTSEPTTRAGASSERASSSTASCNGLSVGPGSPRAVPRSPRQRSTATKPCT